MSTFSSRRERRLWLLLAAVLLGIFSTLTLAQAWAETLGDGPVGAVLFIVACLLILGAVLTQGLTSRPSVAEMGIALAVAAAYLLVFVRMAIPTERSHLVEYGVVALVLLEALTERANHGRRVVMPAVVAIVATALIGAIDECIQWFLPSRVFDPVDMLFNALAAVMAVLASRALAWARGAARREGSSE